MFKRFTSMLLALIMVLGIMPVSVFAEETVFNDWWADAPKVENFSLSCSPELKNCISTSYADGILTVTISEEADAEVWTKEYLYSCSLGTDQVILGPYIVINNEEAEKNVKISTGDNGILMGFEESSKNFTNGNAVAFGLYAADMVVEENGSAKVYPVGDRLMCAVAWKNGETVSYEYMIIELVFENSSVVNIPAGTGIPAIEAVHPDWMFFNGDEYSFIKAEYDEKNGILEYFYVGEKTSMEDIIKELNNVTIKTYISPYTTENTIDDIQLEGFGEAHLTQSDCNITIPCVVDGAINTWETKAIIIDSISDAAPRKLTIKFSVNITNMQDKGFSPVPIERMKIGENAASSFSAGGMNVSIGSKNGKIDISFGNNVSIEAVEAVDSKYITIEAPAEAASFKYTVSTGGNCNNIEDIDYESVTLQYGMTGEAMNVKISPFNSKQVGDITYYYTKSYVLHQDYIIVWLDAGDNVIGKEYVCMEMDPYSKTETADSVTEDELKENGAVTIPTPLSFGKDWKLTCNHFPQHGREGVYYFELEGDENTPDGDKVIYIPYNFIDEDLTFDEAERLKLSPKLHHYSDNHQEKELIKDFELTPYGIRFVISDFSPFVMEWSMDEGGQGGNEEEINLPESTPVSDQVMKIIYDGEVIGQGNIAEGEVEITIPYIPVSDETRIALHIYKGYTGEGAGNVTHYMGGFGEDIMDYVNWQKSFEEYREEKNPDATYEDCLAYWYWTKEQLGTESVVKYRLFRNYDDGSSKRYLDGGGTYSDRLYIQYFDANNKTAVAYEHVDVKIRMEEKDEDISCIKFSQVSFNGEPITGENVDQRIGYYTGVNGATNAFIVEMTEEQLLAHESTAEDGTIWARFEFSAPSENITHFYIAKGSDIENIKNVDLGQFKAYGAESKPGTSQPLGYFEDGNFEQNFFGEKNYEYCIAWYDEATGSIIYQYFRFAYYLPEENQDEGPRGYLPDDFWNVWNKNELVDPNNVEVIAHSAIKDYLGIEYNEEGVLVVTVNKMPADCWKAVYEDLEAGEDGIYVNFNIAPPKSNIEYYADNQGNGPTYENLKNRYKENPNNIKYNAYDGNPLTAGLPVATVAVEGNKTSIFPTRSGGVFYKVIFWKEKGGNVIQQIFPFIVEVADDANRVKFDNGKEYISVDRIGKDGRTGVLSSSYDEKSGVLTYRYIGNKTADEDIANDIRFAYGENDPVYSIQTRVSAPEDGYTCDGRTVVTFNIPYYSENYPLRGSWESFDLVWECEGKEPIHETITIEFDLDKVWMDKYWNPMSNPDRLVYCSITNGRDFMSADEVEAAGVILDLFSKPGRIYTKYDDIDKVDIEKIANLEAWVLPPDAVSRNNDESVEAWMERVYKNTQYVGIKVGATGVYPYEPERAEDQNESIYAWDMEPVDRGAAAENIAGFGELMVDGLKVWFPSTAMDRGGHTVIIDWYKEEETAPSVREYIYSEQDSLIIEQTADTVTEDELAENGAVTVPTPLFMGKDWKLTCNHYPQRNKDGVYYFELEGDENTPVGDKVIYIPYSFIDAELTYEKAIAQKLRPKLHHYDDGHEKKELIKEFQLTEYGIRFVISDFSPFVLDWNVAAIGDETFKTLSDAINVAKEGDTIVLIGDAVEENVLIESGVTLDLNGQMLEAEYTVSFSGAHIIDCSEEKTGILKADEISFNPNNAQMPIWTGEGYAFATIKHQNFIVDSSTGDDKFAIDLRPSFGKKFTKYLFDNGGGDNDIKIVVRMNWDGAEKPLNFEFSDELMRKIYAVSGKTMRINVSGVDQEIFENFTVQVIVTGAGGKVERGGDVYNFPESFKN